MKRRIWNRLIAVGCAAALLMTPSQITVFANEPQPEDISVAEVSGQDVVDDVDNEYQVSGDEFEDQSNISVNHEENIYDESLKDLELEVEEDASQEEANDSIVTEDMIEASQEENFDDKNEQDVIEIDENNNENIVGYTNHSQNEAVAWIRDRKNEGWAKDYDGAAGPQCVDLIKYYFDYLVGYHLNGNGYQFADRTDLPSGWYYTSTPSPGDIAVWKAYTGIAIYWTGHVALVESVGNGTFNYIDINGATGRAGSGSISNTNPSTFIHPDFAPVPVTVSFTPWSNDNYTFIDKTNAAIGMEINVSGGTCTKTGMYLYDSNGSYLAQGKNDSYTLARVYFNINQELGYTLKAGTTYKYKFYAVVNGQTYWSNEYSFTSIPEPTPSDPDLIVVGNGVTAKIVNEDGKSVVYFDSRGGTLDLQWLNILYKRGIDFNGINIIRFTGNSTKMYLPSDSAYMFSLLKNLESIELDKVDTSNVTDMQSMFYACKNLTYVDLSSFNTSKVTDMRGMFHDCYKLKRLDLSGFDTSKVVDMSQMFSECEKLEDLDLSGFDTSSLTSFKDMFWLCHPSRIVTPKKNVISGIKLGTIMVDSFDVEYETFPVLSRSIVLIRKDISKCTVILSNDSYTYDGKEKLPDVTIKDSDVTLPYRDYYIHYENYINAGTATVTIYGDYKYTGTTSKSYTINPATPTLTFANNSISKTIHDASFTNELTKTTDGTVTYKSSNTSVATVNSTNGKVTIKGIGTATITASATAGTNYKAGSASYTLTVIDGRTDISKCTVTLSATSYTYNGKAKKPTVTVQNGTQTLTTGTDYTVAYSNNTNAGTATVAVTGTGNCIGTNSTTFKINKAAPKLTFASESVSKAISDDAFINELTKTTDGTVTLSSSDTNVATVNSTTGIVTIRGAGTATITAAASAGKNYKAGSASYTLDVSGISIENAAVGGVSLSYGYSGKAYTPTVTVKLDGVILTKDTDYTVKYENNQNPGTATITVTGKGKYSGTKIKTFEIVDCVSSVVSGKTYLLIPKNNSKTAVCAYAGKMVNNTKIYITDRGNSESQKFKAVKNSDGTWKFINAKCELALAVQQNSSALGAGLVLYDQTTKPAQNWKLSKKSDNSFAIINSVTGYSIAMSDKSAVKGTTLSMAETASVGLQRFYIVETSAVSAPFDGTNSIRAAKDQSFAVNIASSSKEDGANVSLYTYTNSNARKFKIIYSGGGYYRLVNVNSGLCLTIKDNSDADGANVIQSKWKGYSSQRWKITKNSDGTVTITNMLGTVLHLLGNRTVNNTNIHARKAASTTAQKWYLN